MAGQALVALLADLVRLICLFLGRYSNASRKAVQYQPLPAMALAASNLTTSPKDNVLSTMPPRALCAKIGRVGVSSYTKTPKVVWLIAVLLAFSRSLPFLYNLATRSPDLYRIPVGYLPKDFLAYAALIRQFDQGIFLVNPYTTEPQSGRFILLFHQVLGFVHSLTGADPLILLEISRWPATFAMVLAFWHLMVRLLPPTYPRKSALWLLAFGGGLDGLLRPLLGALLPAPLSTRATQDLWHYYGWSVFEASYNPLWCLGLAGLFLLFRIFLGPNAKSKRLFGAILFLALWYTHVYSAIAFLAAAAGALIADWVADSKPSLKVLANCGFSLVLAFAFIAVITIWQVHDPVFKGSSFGLFGTQAPSVFWYPFTFGAVAVCAVIGFAKANQDLRAALRPFLGWFLGCTWLASSPVFNGYHFVFALFPPLALIAAPTVAGLIHEKGVRTFALFAVLFISSPLVTYTTTKEVLEQSQVPPDAVAVLKRLAEMPPGNVFSPPALGNIIPAFTQHKVFVGQWFMTPEYRLRAKLYEDILSSCDPASLSRIIQEHKISYLVVPTLHVERLQSCLPPLCGHETFGTLALLVLPSSSGCPGKDLAGLMGH